MSVYNLLKLLKVFSVYSCLKFFIYLFCMFASLELFYCDPKSAMGIYIYIYIFFFLVLYEKPETLTLFALVFFLVEISFTSAVYPQVCINH